MEPDQTGRKDLAKLFDPFLRRHLVGMQRVRAGDRVVVHGHLLVRCVDSFVGRGSRGDAPIINSLAYACRAPAQAGPAVRAYAWHAPPLRKRCRYRSVSAAVDNLGRSGRREKKETGVTLTMLWLEL